MADAEETESSIRLDGLHPGRKQSAELTYPVGRRDRGWLWEHRGVAAAVCLAVIAAGYLLMSSDTASPLRLLLISLDSVAVLVLLALALVWLSATASHLPQDTEPMV